MGALSVAESGYLRQQVKPNVRTSAKESTRDADMGGALRLDR